MYRSREPNYEAALMLVRHLDADSLKTLVKDDDEVANLVKNLDQCKEWETEKELRMTENKSLAEYNLSLAPKLEQGKSRLIDLYESVQNVWTNVQDKQSQMKSSTDNLNGETALALLKTAAAESEEESEEILEKFCQNEIEIEKFLEQFQAARKQMHLRRVKADKMKDLLRKPITSNTNGPYPRLPPAVPYPIGAINMPYFPMAK